MAFAELETSATASEVTVRRGSAPKVGVQALGQGNIPRAFLVGSSPEGVDSLPVALVQALRIFHFCLWVWWPLACWGCLWSQKEALNFRKSILSPPLLIKGLIPWVITAAHTNHSLSQAIWNHLCGQERSFLGC